MQFKESTNNIHLSRFCCLNKGVTKVKLVLDETKFLPGDNVSGTLQIDNSKGQFHIKSIAIDLIADVNSQKSHFKNFFEHLLISNHNINVDPKTSR